MDPKGKHRSIYGDRLNKFQTNSKKLFNKEKKLFGGKKLFESDLNIVFKSLSTHYLNAEAPQLHNCFFDIEVEYLKELGYAPPSDPYARITAISLHPAWLDQTICLVVAPDEMPQDVAEDICSKIDGAFLMKNEVEMLMLFLDLIDDTDILSGWNSEGFDIPYVVNRIALILGKEYLKKLCLWDQYPVRKTVMHFSKEEESYDLVGKVHLDYMILYKRYTYSVMHSYSLDSISEHELGEHKVAYDGTLDQLYNNDFDKFIKYSIQDTALLRRLDDKLQYIDLVNMIAHANTVRLQTVLGSVAQIDQAIINDAHMRGLVVPDKRHGEESIQAAGAYVAHPKIGLHSWIGSIDLNSLYPSILRACNMSPETIVAQIRQDLTNAMIDTFKKAPKKGNETGEDQVAKAWEGKFACLEYDLVMEKNKETLLYLDYEDGRTEELTGAQIHHKIFAENRPWILSSNGTVFTTEHEGVVPHLLTRWYSERKELQQRKKNWGRVASGIKIPDRLL
jgi:DNA polymerase elongation subunit (family B)